MPHKQSRPIANRCFDHLGGKLSVRLMDAFLQNGWIRLKEGRSSIYEITDIGYKFFDEIGVDLSDLR